MTDFRYLTMAEVEEYIGHTATSLQEQRQELLEVHHNLVCMSMDLKAAEENLALSKVSTYHTASPSDTIIDLIAREVDNLTHKVYVLNTSVVGLENTLDTASKFRANMGNQNG